MKILTVVAIICLVCCYFISCDDLTNNSEKTTLNPTVLHDSQTKTESIIETENHSIQGTKELTNTEIESLKIHTENETQTTLQINNNTTEVGSNCCEIEIPLLTADSLKEYQELIKRLSLSDRFGSYTRK